MNHPPRHKIKLHLDIRQQLALWAGLSALEGFAGVIYLAGMPADPKNVALLGYSLPRLALMALFLLVSLGLGSLAVQWIRRPRWSEAFERELSNEKRRRWLACGAFILSMAAWTLTFLPESRFGSLAGYSGRLRPLFAWGLLVGVQTFLLAVTSGEEKSLLKLLRRVFNPGRAGLAVLLASMAVWLLIAKTGVGLKPDTVHWNDNGVPVTGLQVLGALLLGLGLGRLVDRLEAGLAARKPSQKAGRTFELAVCLGVWAAAAILWSQAPMQRNFFAPGPYPPNSEFYPFSDSVTYDTSAQMARLGLLYSGGAHVDKPLYSLILLGLQVISGNRYNLLLAWQAVLLAALPMCVYQIAKRLRSRAAGFAAAGLVAAKEINAYQTVSLQVSHSKLILSEVPTALLLALFAYFMICWLENGGRKIGYAALAGGALGLSTLLRHNPWFLLPLVALAALWVYRNQWRSLLLSAALFGVALLAAILPWAVRTAQTTGSPLYFLGALEGVVWGQRYEPALETSSAPRPDAAQPQGPGTDVTAEPTTQAAVEIPPEPAPAAVKPPPAAPRAGMFSGLLPVLQFVSSHFFHNLIASDFVLPTQIRLDDLSHLVSGPESIYPLSSWTGRLNLEQGIAIFLSLAGVSLGVGSAFRARGFSGGMVLLVFLGYSLASALARTSGGRYIVPVDWALPIYFATGWIQCLEALFPKKNQNEDQRFFDGGTAARQSWRRTALLGGAIFLAVGLALPLSERLIPLKPFPNTRDQVLAILEEKGALNALGMGPEEVEGFLDQKGAVLVAGEALYPRFYRIDEGEPDPTSFLKPMKFPRLTFTVIGQQGGYVLLPMEKPPEALPNGADVIVLGCQGVEYLDAAAVIVNGAPPGEAWVYQRSPEAPLECPLPQPVCDDNRVCR